MAKKRLTTAFNKEIAEGVMVKLQQSADGKRHVLTFDSDSPLSDEMLLGCLVVYLQEKVPDLIMSDEEFRDFH